METGIYNEINLYNACQKGDLETLKCLTDSGCEYDKEEAVYQAIYNDRLEILEFLERQFDLKTRILFFLEIASMADSRKIIKVLLGYINVSLLQHKVAKRLLHDALFFRSYELIDLLIEKGVKEYLICYVDIHVKYKDLYIRYKSLINRARERAAKKIYFWWIPICYAISGKSGERMMRLNYNKYTELYLEK